MPTPCHSHGWQRVAKIIHIQQCVYATAHTHANKSTCEDNLCLPPFPTHTHAVPLLGKGGAGHEWDIVLTDHSSTSEWSHTSKTPPTHTGWPSCLCPLNHNTCFFVCVRMGVGLYSSLFKLWQLGSVLLPTEVCINNKKHGKTWPLNPQGFSFSKLRILYKKIKKKSFNWLYLRLSRFEMCSSGNLNSWFQHSKDG